MTEESLKARPCCVYCIEKAATTVDHVPPKLFLGKPYPPNLWTVPACEDCNKAFQKDDEYTRTVLAIDIRASDNPAAQVSLPAILRSLQRPTARGFADYLARQSTPTKILSSDERPFGNVIHMDVDRINATGRRLIRGLYFLECGRPLPLHADVKVGSKTSLSSTHPDMLNIASVFAKFPLRDAAAGEAFSYVSCFGEGVSFWLMVLYDYFFWLGTVDERQTRVGNG